MAIPDKDFAELSKSLKSAYSGMECESTICGFVG
jgi:hypothetical protein